MLTVAVLAPLLVALVLLARGRLLLVAVHGTSMVPTLRPQDRVLALRVPAAYRIRHGRLVVCRTPPAVGGTGLLVKRVAAVAGDPLPSGRPGYRVPTGRIFVLGDNPRGTDSRHFGAIPRRDVVALVVVRLGGTGNVAR